MDRKLEPLTFRPKARLPRQLGEELITDEVIAAFELVKNAYDADATEISITLPHEGNSFGGEIVIADNGHGMSYEDIRDRWMEPGTDRKRHVRFSPGGRILLGEKGIGRFAADKLAARLELRSKKPGADSWVSVEFDWNRFTGDQYLDEIENEAREIAADHPDDHGTVLRMSSLRSIWSRRRVEALVLHLRSLFPPGADETGLKITVNCEGHEDLSGILKPLDLKEATCSVEIVVDADGRIRRRRDGICETIKAVPIGCGALRVRLCYFDPNARRLWAQRTQVKWEEWAGIRLYRDGVRVLPFGRPGNDWLGLNEQQAKKHSNLAVRDLLGYVLISREGNPGLEDTTSREGLVENDAYRAMRGFLREEIDGFSDYIGQVKSQQKEEQPETAGKGGGVPVAGGRSQEPNDPKPDSSARGLTGKEPSPIPRYGPDGPNTGQDKPFVRPLAKPEKGRFSDELQQLVAVKECVESARKANDCDNRDEIGRWLRAAEDHLEAILGRLRG